MTREQQHVEITLPTGHTLRVEPVAAHTFRVRVRPDSLFPEPSLLRYGIVRREWPPVDFETEESNESLTIKTARASLTISRADGRVTLCDGAGRALTREATPAQSERQGGFAAEFMLADGERLYGLGDVTRACLQRRGRQTDIWVTNVTSYVPIPYLMSDRGWALFVNTTWKLHLDLGVQQPDRLRLQAADGDLDYYLIAGDDYPALLDRYTDIVGKPVLLPQWGYGLTFVCNMYIDARGMLEDCCNFRREGIPCDVVGLEPGWMQNLYDYSVDKKWHGERFVIPRWASGSQTFVGAARRMGFKLSLWLCCDYDLSWEEERRVRSESHPGDKPETTQYSTSGENLLFTPQTGVLIDTITKRDEPWFEHLKEFVDQGARAFKLDGSNQTYEHPDRKWGNGMDDREMHNLYPLLLSKQMALGFREHTASRPMVYTANGYAGIQQYSATWAGDTGGGSDAIACILNHGMSGHSNTTCDMDVDSPMGIHFGFLQPWSQISSWAYWDHPRFLGDKLSQLVKSYARLRYRLIPYIYSMAHVAARTGMPIARAMPLAFPNDPSSDELLCQYMLGDAFLVAAFTDQIHLPEGTWIDYWTGERYVGPRDLTYCPPEGRGGPLFLRAGAIVPSWPDMDYVGHRPVDTLGLHVYPHGDSSFTLFEDDGVSFVYLQGAVAETSITCQATQGKTTLTIGPRAGSYQGMPTTRSFDVSIHLSSAPAQVIIDGKDATAAWRYDSDIGAVRLKVTEDPEKRLPVTITCLWA